MRRIAQKVIAQSGYSEAELPSEAVIRQRLNQLGYRLKQMTKTKLQKVIARTEASLAKVNRIYQAANSNADDLRLSIDALMLENRPQRS